MRWGAAAFWTCLLSAPGMAMAGPVHLSSFAPGHPPDGAVALCRAFAGACHRAGGGGGVLHDDAAILAVAQAANREVNRDISPGVVGSKPWRLVRTGSGDCTNYVAAKKHRLVRAGVPPDKLLAAVVIGADAGLHAVLVLRLATGDLVLDNLDDAIRPWARTRYTFLKMQNAANGSRWDVVLLGPRASRI